MTSLLELYVVQLDNKYDAANAYVDAAHCYKKTSKKGSLQVLFCCFVTMCDSFIVDRYTLQRFECLEFED